MDFGLIPTKDEIKANGQCSRCLYKLTFEPKQSYKLGYRVRCNNCKKSYNPLQNTWFVLNFLMYRLLICLFLRFNKSKLDFQKLLFIVFVSVLSDKNTCFCCYHYFM